MLQRRPLLELKEARVVRDGRAILDVDHLVLYERERTAILGPNGSGKSTLIKVLTRDVRPRHVEGEPAVRLLGRERWDLFEARALFGVVSPDLSDTLGRRITVFEAIVSGFFGSVGIPSHRTPTHAQLRTAEALMAELGVEDLTDRTMTTLSTGEARRVLIARALVHDPPVLVLDEPCDGLDPYAVRTVLTSVRALARSGQGLIIVTHHIEDIVPEVERVILLKAGRIVGDGPASEMLTSERISDLYGMDAKVIRDGDMRRVAWEWRDASSDAAAAPGSDR